MKVLLGLSKEFPLKPTINRNQPNGGCKSMYLLRVKVAIYQHLNPTVVKQPPKICRIQMPHLPEELFCA